YLTLGIIQAPSLQFTGAIADPGSLAQEINALILNGQSAAGGINFVTSAAATALISGGFNLLLRLTNGGAVVVTIDSAYNLVNSLPQPETFGQKFQFQIVTTGATTVATPTLSDTAVTLAGTTTVLAAASRWYQGQVTQLTSTTGITTTAGTTFVSLT